MDVRSMLVFVHVADYGGVTRAAEALHLSSSAVSQTLVGLERELNVGLFHRLPRGMALTDAGEALLTPARRVLHETELARRSVDAVRGLLTGQLTIAAISGMSVALADLLGEFSERYPDVLLRVLQPESPDVVLDEVRSGVCEVGLTWVSAGVEDLQAWPGVVDRAVVVLPQGHRLAGATTIDHNELEGERVIASLETSTMRPLFDSIFVSHGVKPKIVAEAATNEMVLELVRAGVGCTITFGSSVRPVVNRGVVTVPFEAPRPMDIQLVTRLRQEPTPAARALIELAAARGRSAGASTFCG